jgi:hypothetical protein
MFVDHLKGNRVAGEHPVVVGIIFAPFELIYCEDFSVVLDKREKVEDASIRILVEQLVRPENNC